MRNLQPDPEWPRGGDLPVDHPKPDQLGLLVRCEQHNLRNEHVVRGHWLIVDGKDRLIVLEEDGVCGDQSGSRDRGPLVITLPLIPQAVHLDPAAPLGLVLPAAIGPTVHAVLQPLEGGIRLLAHPELDRALALHVTRSPLGDRIPDRLALVALVERLGVQRASVWLICGRPIQWRAAEEAVWDRIGGRRGVVGSV